MLIRAVVLAAEPVGPLVGKEASMSLGLSNLDPVVALLFGVLIRRNEPASIRRKAQLILIFPKFLNYLIAIYLILIGIIGLGIIR